MKSDWQTLSAAPWLADESLAKHRLRLTKIREKRLQLAFDELSAYKKLDEWLSQSPQARHQIFDQAQVTIGKPEEISSSQKQALLELLQEQMPWKKGPFSIFGIDIDSEWRSDLKWDRLVPHLGSFKGQTIADIGCHNGYFMYRMLPYNPKLVLGFEPVSRHWLSFQLLNRLAARPELYFELLGVEHIGMFPQFFDQIFCLGILYHHTDPVGLLRKMRRALKPGGTLWIDCQGIAGEEALALVPKGRYANARGIWFLPTQSALENWVRRAGFHHVNCIYSGALSTTEQRSTTWAPVKSLVDFLDPQDPTRTIEGYPAPWRFYLKVT